MSGETTCCLELPGVLWGRWGCGWEWRCGCWLRRCPLAGMRFGCRAGFRFHSQKLACPERVPRLIVVSAGYACVEPGLLQRPAFVTQTAVANLAGSIDQVQ